MDLYPLTFESRLVPKIWGGRKLETLFGRRLPAGQAIGESWELCDRKEFSSPVAQGPLQGLNLHALLQEFGPHLIGEAAYGQGLERFPLLVKLIDAGDDLSVQVHPDDDYAALRLGSGETGKTEIWVMLQADAGAQVVAGLKSGMDRDAFYKALKEGKLEPVLNRFPVKEGDAIFVPAGRIHALGRGSLVAEFQQNSDTTYRVYDYGRLENGKPRALHIQQAMETIRFDRDLSSQPDLLPQKILRADDYNHSLLVECPYFKVSRVWVNPRFSPVRKRRAFHVVMAQRGLGRLEWQGGSIPLVPGATVLCPANVEWNVQREGNELELIWVTK